MKLVKDADELQKDANDNHHFIRIMFRDVFLKNICI
ncbi:MAG: hypothetical protein PARBA_00007 [Parabacteroides sp.]